MKYIITLFILFTSLNLYAQSIITEDVIMCQDSFPKYWKSDRPYATLELHPEYITTFTYWPQQSELQDLKDQIGELKSQVKELSELLITLINK